MSLDEVKYHCVMKKCKYFNCFFVIHSILHLHNIERSSTLTIEIKKRMFYIRLFLLGDPGEALTLYKKLPVASFLVKAGVAGHKPRVLKNANILIVFL